MTKKTKRPDLLGNSFAQKEVKSDCFIHIACMKKEKLAFLTAANGEKLSNFIRRTLMKAAVDKFLSDKGCNGTELLAHGVTADTQTAREWAEEFVENNPEGLHGGLWDWDDFDTLEEITEKVESGEMVVDDGIAKYVN